MSDDWEGNEEELGDYKRQQQFYYETEFLHYIRDESDKDHKFLSRFVECCTGSSYLPYVSAGSDPFKIYVEFNLSIDLRCGNSLSIFLSNFFIKFTSSSNLLYSYDSFFATINHEEPSPVSTR